MYRAKHPVYQPARCGHFLPLAIWGRQHFNLAQSFTQLQYAGLIYGQTHHIQGECTWQYLYRQYYPAGTDRFRLAWKFQPICHNRFLCSVYRNLCKPEQAISYGCLGFWGWQYRFGGQCTAYLPDRRHLYSELNSNGSGWMHLYFAKYCNRQRTFRFIAIYRRVQMLS